MTRLIVFLGFLLLAFSAFYLKGYKNLPSSNTPFNYEKSKKEFLAKEKLKKELLNKKPVVKKVAVVEEANPYEIALDTDQLKRGHSLYTSKGKCVSCHGKYGKGKKSQSAPRLAGQLDWYLYEQLVDMKAGKRVNVKMNPYLKKLTDADFKDIAAFLSKLPKF